MIFQVEVAPTQAELNQQIAIINETSVNAVDAFTQNNINKTYDELMSNKIYDALTNASYGRVQDQN